MKRNLLYHIYPRAGNGIWQWNVAELRQRLNQFDGQRVVAIMTAPDADPPATVQAEFGGHDRISWLILPNNPHLREVASFLPLFARVAEPDDGITFYGHAKGVTQAGNEAVRIWSQALYSVCLDVPTAIDEHLSRFVMTGAIRKTERFLSSAWHYHGSFFWFRNDFVFSSDWMRIDSNSHGIEAWPGSLTPKEHAGCLLLEDAGSGYDLAYCRNMIIPQLQQWRRSKGLNPSPIS